MSQFKVGDRVFITKGDSYSSGELDGTYAIIEKIGTSPNIDKPCCKVFGVDNWLWLEELRHLTPLEQLL